MNSGTQYASVQATGMFERCVKGIRICTLFCHGLALILSYVDTVVLIKYHMHR